MTTALSLILGLIATVAVLGLMFWLGTGANGARVTPALVVRLVVVFIPTTAACAFLLLLAAAVAFPSGFPPLLGVLFTLLCAAGISYLTCLRSSAFPPNRIGSIALGAFVTGGVAFSAGFFGPMLLTPDSLHAPLLGLFVTGPVGFLAGGCAGAFYWSSGRARRTARADSGAVWPGRSEDSLRSAGTPSAGPADRSDSLSSRRAHD